MSETMPVEEVVQQPEVLFVQQPTRDFLERYFAEKILSIKNGLDEVYDPKEDDEGGKLTALQSLKAFWNICRTEVGEVVDLFGTIKQATLTPNHRKVMVISKHFNNLIQSNDIINETDENSANCMKFAEWAIDYLKTLHTCLLNYENKKVNIIKEREKKDLVEAFCEYAPNVIEDKPVNEKKKRASRKSKES